MMRSLNTGDIQGAQPKKVVVRQRYHSNQSTINLTTGEQILNPMPNGSKEQFSPIIEQQPGHKGKKGFHNQQVDSIKNIMENQNNPSACQGDIDSILHLNHQNKSNNSDQFIVNSGQQLNQLNLGQGIFSSSPVKASPIKNNNISTRRQRQQSSDLEDLNNKNIPNDYPKNADFEKPFQAETSKLMGQSGQTQKTSNQQKSQQINNTQQDKNKNSNAGLAIEQLPERSKPQEENQILFYSDQMPVDQLSKQQSRLPRIQSKSLVSNLGYLDAQKQNQGSKLQSFLDSPEIFRKRGIYSKNSLLQEKSLGIQDRNSPLISDGEQLLLQQKLDKGRDIEPKRQSVGRSSRGQQLQQQSYSELKSKLAQSALNPQPYSLSDQKDNQRTAPNSSTVLQGASRDHRIVVVCDSCNSARDAINRFLSLRSLVGYEIFSLPGGPGSLLMEEPDIRQCWQNALAVFLTTISKIYQIQEIQLFSSFGSLFSKMNEAEGTILKNQIAFHESLTTACDYVQTRHSFVVKGFTINQKGIVDKIC